MCDVLLILDVLLIRFSTLSECEKIMKFCSESIFSVISSVTPLASVSRVTLICYPEFLANTITYIY
jgi:hypothetical protein